MSLTDRIAASAARLHGLRGFPIIETERLLLREPRPGDVDAVFALFSDPQHMRYWSRLPMVERGEAEAYLASLPAHYEKRDAITWIVADPEHQQMLGTCTLYDIQLNHLRCGVGYALLPQYQGQGFASEAAGNATAWALEYLDLHKVEGEIHPDNLASRRVLERCGFHSEAVLRQRFVLGEEIQDSEIFARFADYR